MIGWIFQSGLFLDSAVRCSGFCFDVPICDPSQSPEKIFRITILYCEVFGAGGIPIATPQPTARTGLDAIPPLLPLPSGPQTLPFMEAPLLPRYDPQLTRREALPASQSSAARPLLALGVAGVALAVCYHAAQAASNHDLPPPGICIWPNAPPR